MQNVFILKSKRLGQVFVDFHHCGDAPDKSSEVDGSKWTTRNNINAVRNERPFGILRMQKCCFGHFNGSLPRFSRDFPCNSRPSPTATSNLFWCRFICWWAGTPVKVMVADPFLFLHAPFGTSMARFLKACLTSSMLGSAVSKPKTCNAMAVPELFPAARRVGERTEGKNWMCVFLASLLTVGLLYLLLDAQVALFGNLWLKGLQSEQQSKKKRYITFWFSKACIQSVDVLQAFPNIQSPRKASSTVSIIWNTNKLASARFPVCCLDQTFHPLAHCENPSQGVIRQRQVTFPETIIACKSGCWKRILHWDFKCSGTQHTQHGGSWMNTNPNGSQITHLFTSLQVILVSYSSSWGQLWVMRIVEVPFLEPT